VYQPKMCVLVGVYQSINTAVHSKSFQLYISSEQRSTKSKAAC